MREENKRLRRRPAGTSSRGQGAKVPWWKDTWMCQVCLCEGNWADRQQCRRCHADKGTEPPKKSDQEMQAEKREAAKGALEKKIKGQEEVLKAIKATKLEADNDEAIGHMKQLMRDMEDKLEGYRAELKGMKPPQAQLQSALARAQVLGDQVAAAIKAEDRARQELKRQTQEVTELKDKWEKAQKEVETISIAITSAGGAARPEADAEMEEAEGPPGLEECLAGLDGQACSKLRRLFASLAGAGGAGVPPRQREAPQPKPAPPAPTPTPGPPGLATAKRRGRSKEEEVKGTGADQERKDGRSRSPFAEAKESGGEDASTGDA